MSEFFMCEGLGGELLRGENDPIESANWRRCGIGELDLSARQRLGRADLAARVGARSQRGTQRSG